MEIGGFLVKVGTFFLNEQLFLLTNEMFRKKWRHSENNTSDGRTKWIKRSYLRTSFSKDLEKTRF